MFQPKTERIKILAEKFPQTIIKLEEIFDKPTNVYIDYANAAHWQGKLGWHIDIKRLKQLFDSFDTIKKINFYYGTLDSEQHGNSVIDLASKCCYSTKTKPVKIMKWSIDVSGIEINSPAILKDFISKPLLHKLDLETIEFLNKKLGELNKQGIKHIKVLKCNFDVEMGRDMLLDYEHDGIENFILWSGDSDFADPVNQLLDDNKKVVICSIARRVSVELAETKAKIFDIRKIKEFICFPKELQDSIKQIP